MLITGLPLTTRQRKHKRPSLSHYKSQLTTQLLSALEISVSSFPSCWLLGLPSHPRRLPHSVTVERRASPTGKAITEKLARPFLFVPIAREPSLPSAFKLKISQQHGGHKCMYIYIYI